MQRSAVSGRRRSAVNPDQLDLFALLEGVPEAEPGSG